MIIIIVVIEGAAKGEGRLMKTIVKRQYADFIEHIEFPVVVYIYETGRVIAMNEYARNILGSSAKNMNLVWAAQVKQKLSRPVLDHGSELLFNKMVLNGRDKLEIDIEINAVVLDNVHILICFFEQSYKQQFIKQLRIQTPRMYVKDKKLSFVSVNKTFLEDAGLKADIKGTDNGDYLEPSVSDIIEANEKEVMNTRECTYDLVQTIKICTVDDYFAKMNRMPLINKNGTCIGMLGIYTLLLNRKEYKHLFDSTLREKHILSEAVSRSDTVVISWREDKGWPIEYVSPNFGKLGFNMEDFYTGRLCWQDIVYEEDYKRIVKDYEDFIKQGKHCLISEYRIINSAGEKIWVRDETTHVVREQGECYREGLLKEITDEMAASAVGSPDASNPMQRYREYLYGLPSGLKIAMPGDSGEQSPIEQYLRKAINKGCVEFDIFYQPVVNSRNKEVVGAEALLRWRSPELGFINPVDFIPLSEYLGLIVPLGEHVIREVFRTSREWNRMVEGELLLNINLSVVQLVQPDIVNQIQRIVKELSADCSRIVFEVTESLAVEDMNLMKNVLCELKKMGFKIALDDFGTGYSSLNHIMEMPLDYIKIDKNFISAYGTKHFNPSLLSAITELAHSMGVEIIVEGVETKQQMEFLMFLNTDKYQGYLYGKPMPKEEFYNRFIGTDQRTV